MKAVGKPVRVVEPNLFVFSPLINQIWGSRDPERLTAALLRWKVKVRRVILRLRFRTPFNSVFNPAAGVLVGRLEEDRVN